MVSETVTIPKEEYIRLKKIEEIDQKLLNQFVKSLKDVKHGRIEEWKD